MIRIVDEEEIRSIVPQKGALKEDERDLLEEIRQLKAILARKDQSNGRVLTVQGQDQAGTEGYRVKIDVLRKEAEDRNLEIAKLRDRHERDVEIIARLHTEIDALRSTIADLEKRIGEVLARETRPAQFSERHDVHVARVPAGQTDIQEAELVALPGQDFVPVEATPLYGRRPSRDDEVLGAVVIPLGDPGVAITPTKPVKYRPLD